MDNRKFILGYWAYDDDGNLVDTSFEFDKHKIVKKDPVDKPKNIHYDSTKVIVKELTCKRCGRSWLPRSKKKPVQCPKCKSPYWNKNRKR